MADRLGYARKYCHVLARNDAQDLLSLSNEKRKHAMKALANLSKFMGCYNQWKDIRERYQLTWSNGDSLQAFEDIFNSENNLSSMIKWLKDTVARIPKPYGNILLFNALTGLRPDEACHSVNLIHNDYDNYLRKTTPVLEHFKYPQTFIRRTKKAYISIVTDDVLRLAKEAGPYSYTAVRMQVVRRGMLMHMKYCRKIFSTYLRTKGLEPEIIDLLQGRVPKTVFSRHYFRPDFEFQNIARILATLHRDITD